MYNLYLTLIIILNLFSGDSIGVKHSENSKFQISICPSQNSINQSIIEDFLTKDDWSESRSETNTENLSVSNIVVLSDSNFSSECSEFNVVYEEAIEEKNGLEEQAYNLTYYKNGNFYFIVISIRQSDTANYVTMGMSFIHVYNQNQQLIKAYAF